MYKQKYSVAMDNGHNIYSLTWKAVYHKFIGLVHEQKQWQKILIF